MKRILIIAEYLGSAFCGWQSQTNGPSVQDALERAIFEVTGERTRVIGAGRTDSGVHALGQAAHFDTDSAIPPERFAPALNARLQDALRVKSSREVPNRFHARYSAESKTYVYRMYRSELVSPLRRDTAARISPRVRTEPMAEAAKALVGTRDFASFRAAGSDTEGSVRTIYAADFSERGDEVYFTITGSGFLYRMVRNIVGTLLEIGQGKRAPEEMEAILAAGDRSAAGPTAPARGLYLYRVEYGGAY